VAARARQTSRAAILAAIAAGGALGASARYELSQVIHVARDSFPWSTFTINVSGSFLLGFLLVMILDRFAPGRYLRPFAATGFLGAYTTYSTFAVETDLLLKDGHAAIGLAYGLGSLLAGFVAVWAGIWLARFVGRVERGGGA
jgi:CrcB protein